MAISVTDDRVVSPVLEKVMPVVVLPIGLKVFEPSSD